MAQQGSDGDPSEEKDTEETDDEEEQKNRGTGGEDATPGVEAEREPDGEEFTTSRPRHIPGGTWLHKPRPSLVNPRPYCTLVHIPDTLLSYLPKYIDQECDPDIANLPIKPSRGWRNQPKRTKKEL
ncbi:hypothetical protein NDU88_001120 [Pleurodeles waltl]|uniref:Uncharacterized protein n=1 Tax=Pleurodeles waltl TaxID=8319 RepID=A0AAV7MMK5_PLEWA|nr:hypothetical protein NDU88_001120 [Pleurodeles waltl]